MSARAEVVVDLAAIRTSVARLVEAAPTAAVMAVVKADGYGHGMLPSARAALAGGASWLGAAVLEEALELRAAGITVPILSWLASPGEQLERGVRADIDLSASAEWMLEEIAAAARVADRPARVHLKVDTGLSRAGATVADWPDLVRTGLRLQAEGVVQLVGAWSHFARADAPADPTVRGQVDVFTQALGAAADLGFTPELRHLANSAATLASPEAHFDLVRPGISVYGLSPGPEVGTAEALGLVPAMTLRASAALVKRVPAGSGVSYGHRYITPRETTLALVPLGYADGVPRVATNTAEVFVGGRRRRIAGTVCMDQFVLDVEDDPVRVGDDIVLFGPGDRGEPTAQDWAEALGTINYEIVTRIGPRIPRRYVGDSG
ncbi:MAG TPA: alanine racemase [Frankiaceae bacterium]|nr:alanine racemase [Frankiaceae bacterium]